MSKLDQALYTARTRTTGGRDGSGRSSDGAIDVQLAAPGSGRPGTNSEQLLGIGWSACFIGAMRLAAGKFQLRLPEETAVEAEVTLGKTDGGRHHALAAQLTIDLPGLDGAMKHALVETAHQTCPYSRATRGNVDVQFRIL